MLFCWHPLKNLNKLSTDTKCYIDDFNLALVFYNVIFAWHGTEATWCWVNIKQILRRIFTNVILKCSRVTNLVQSSKQITRERSSVRAVFWCNNVVSKEHNEKDTTVNLKLIALPVSSFFAKEFNNYMLWKVCFLWLVVAKYLRCRRLWFKKTRFNNNLRVTRSKDRKLQLAG